MNFGDSLTLHLAQPAGKYFYLLCDTVDEMNLTSTTSKCNNTLLYDQIAANYRQYPSNISSLVGVPVIFPVFNSTQHLQQEKLNLSEICDISN